MYDDASKFLYSGKLFSALDNYGLMFACIYIYYYIYVCQNGSTQVQYMQKKG